jgi:hypothetical protein
MQRQRSSRKPSRCLRCEFRWRHGSARTFTRRTPARGNDLAAEELGNRTAAEELARVAADESRRTAGNRSEKPDEASQHGERTSHRPTAVAATTGRSRTGSGSRRAMKRARSSRSSSRSSAWRRAVRRALTNSGCTSSAIHQKRDRQTSARMLPASLAASLPAQRHRRTVRIGVTNLEFKSSDPDLGRVGEFGHLNAGDPHEVRTECAGSARRACTSRGGISSRPARAV